MRYFRVQPETQMLLTLNNTKQFKIALKNKIYNLFIESANMNLSNQELALIYEDDPVFHKFKTSNLLKKHRKCPTSVLSNDTVSTILYMSYLYYR